MVQVSIDATREFQEQVVGLLQAEGIDATYGHSGGGIFGVLIVTDSGRFLFGTLVADDDGEYALPWIGFDWCEKDAELIANIEVQERPLGNSYGDTPTPARHAAAIARLVRSLR